MRTYPEDSTKSSILTVVARVTICFFFFAILTKAQYRFDHWTEENGLPHNWTKGILQTRDGYLWITTGQGIARFDGVRFKLFNRANTPALSSDRFSLYAIREDRAGNLWMGTEDGGAIIYHEGVFTSLTSAQGLPGDSVLRIDEDSEGIIWIFTTAGLARWKEGYLLPTIPDSRFNEFPSAAENLGADAKYFGLWRKNQEGLHRFAFGKWNLFPLPPLIKNAAQLQINSMIEDANGRVLYTVPNQPKEYYLVEDGQLTIKRARSDFQTVYYEDQRGRLWLSDQNNNPAVTENNLLKPISDLSGLEIKQMLEDREGTIWITTLNRGLFRLKRQFVSVFLHPGGTEYNNIQPLMQDRAGNIWVGSGGLARFTDNGFENFYHNGLSRSPKFERNVLIALFEDGDGSFWLGVRKASRVFVMVSWKKTKRYQLK